MNEPHVDTLLPAYLDHELNDTDLVRVERHLNACSECRATAERMRLAAAKIRAVEIAALPQDDEQRILATIRQEASRLAAADPQEADKLANMPERSPFRRWAAIAAAAAAAVVLVGLFLLRLSPNVTVRAAEGPLTSLESVALEARRELGQGQKALDFQNRSPAEVRRWLEERQLSAALVVDRPAEELASFELLGVADLSRPERRAAAISYRIDGLPVLLIAALEAQTPDAPHWGLFGKHILFREQEGARLLTWTNSGKAYTLVSDLPELGQRACLICHTDTARRRLVEHLGDHLETY